MLDTIIFGALSRGEIVMLFAIFVRLGLGRDEFNFFGSNAVVKSFVSSFSRLPRRRLSHERRRNTLSSPIPNALRPRRGRRRDPREHRATARHGSRRALSSAERSLHDDGRTGYERSKQRRDLY